MTRLKINAATRLVPVAAFLLQTIDFSGLFRFLLTYRIVNTLSEQQGLQYQEQT